MGGFNFPDIHWEYHTAVSGKPGKFLKHVEGNFQSQALSKPSRKGVLRGLMFENREGLAGEVMVGGCLAHSDQVIVEFKIFDAMRKKVSRVAILAS